MWDQSVIARPENNKKLCVCTCTHTHLAVGFKLRIPLFEICKIVCTLDCMDTRINSMSLAESI